MQRHIERYAVTSIVKLDCNGKDHLPLLLLHQHTNRSRTLNNNATRASLQYFISVTGIVTLNVTITEK